MNKNPLIQLGNLGQSVWLDYIRRNLIASGELRRLIADDGIKGMTSNPAIFEEAIVDSHDYDSAIQTMARAGKSAAGIYESLSQQDVRDAADEFLALYESSDGKEGYVSLEVNPMLANDSRGTVAEARRLWVALGRPNILIKVPATAEGLPAIQQLIREGINVNVTLLFGLPRYRQVAKAYIAGLNERLADGHSIHAVASVASFFISRIDVAADPRLKGNPAQGQVAIASAVLAYQIFKEIFASASFQDLASKGAQVQRLLWASTSVKDPAYDPLKYVEALIGPDTVDTIPPGTLNTYRERGKPALRLEQDVEEARQVLDSLPGLGIDLGQVTHELEIAGVRKFKEPFSKLMDSLAFRAADQTLKGVQA